MNRLKTRFRWLNVFLDSLMLKQRDGSFLLDRAGQYIFTRN